MGRRRLTASIPYWLRSAPPWIKSAMLLGPVSLYLAVVGWWTFGLTAPLLLGAAVLAGWVWGRTERLTAWGVAAGAAVTVAALHALWALTLSAPNPLWGGVCGDPTMDCAALFGPLEELVYLGWGLTAPGAAAIAVAARGGTLSARRLRGWWRRRRQVESKTTRQIAADEVIASSAAAPQLDRARGVPARG